MIPGLHLQGPALAEMIDKYRVTIAAGVPTIWTGLYHELMTNKRDVSCIRALVVGGWTMPERTSEKLRRIWGSVWPMPGA